MGYTHSWIISSIPSSIKQKMNRDLVKVKYNIEHFYGGLITRDGDVAIESNFKFPGRRGFNFCKTDYHGYDLYVMVVLLIAKNHLQERMELSSDGVQKDEEGATEIDPRWMLGIDEYNSFFPEKPISGIRVEGIERIELNF